MTLETAFSLASILAIMGWLLLLASPWLPISSNSIAGFILPLALSLGYLVLLALPSARSEGGFGSLAQVMELFTNEQAMLAGWLHYLAFDLFIGAWICRRARSEGIRFLFVFPCLPLTFMFGPLGLLTYFGVSSVHRFLNNRLSNETGF